MKKFIYCALLAGILCSISTFSTGHSSADGPTPTVAANAHTIVDD